MLLSMTGFGRAEAVEKNLGVLLRFEISSVNRKQFDVKFALAKEIALHEGALRTRLSRKISRGSILVRSELVFLDNAPSALRIDHAFLQTVYNEAKQFAQTHALSQDISVTDLFRVPGVIVPASPVTETPEFEEFLFGVFDAAIENHIRMRTTEGANLEADLLARISSFEKIVAELKELVKGQPELQAERLRERMKNAGFATEADDERLLKEFVIFADKLDVTEEVTRLESHFSHFRELVADPQPAGRSLDFLMQEMFREINTLGNKAASPLVSPKVVELKTGIEQVREQVQNIE